MLLTRTQLEQLENALFNEWGAGMKARPDLVVKNERTKYGAVLIIKATIKTFALEGTDKMIHVSTCGIDNLLSSISAEGYGTPSLFVNYTDGYVFISVFVHAHKN